MKYKRKDEFIEVFHYTGQLIEEVQKFCPKAWIDIDGYMQVGSAGLILPGDYICKSEYGIYYGEFEIILHKNYEPVIETKNNNKLKYKIDLLIEISYFDDPRLPNDAKYVAEINNAYTGMVVSSDSIAGCLKELARGFEVLELEGFKLEIEGTTL